MFNQILLSIFVLLANFDNVNSECLKNDITIKKNLFVGSDGDEALIFKNPTCSEASITIIDWDCASDGSAGAIFKHLYDQLLNIEYARHVTLQNVKNCKLFTKLTKLKPLLVQPIVLIDSSLHSDSFSSLKTLEPPNVASFCAAKPTKLIEVSGGSFKLPQEAAIIASVTCITVTVPTPQPQAKSEEKSTEAISMTQMIIIVACISIPSTIIICALGLLVAHFYRKMKKLNAEKKHLGTIESGSKTTGKSSSMSVEKVPAPSPSLTAEKVAGPLPTVIDQKVSASSSSVTSKEANAPSPSLSAQFMNDVGHPIQQQKANGSDGKMVNGDQEQTVTSSLVDGFYKANSMLNTASEYSEKPVVAQRKHRMEESGTMSPSQLNTMYNEKNKK